MAYEMLVRSIAINNTTYEDGEQKLDLLFEPEDKIVGKGVMSWNLKVDSLSFDGENIACLARRTSQVEKNGPYTPFSIHIRNDGLWIVDVGGSRLFQFKDELARSTFTHFLKLTLASHATKI